MDLFAIVGKYFWLICLLINGINYVRARRHVEHAAIGGDYDVDAATRYLALFSIALSLPWLVMGAGILCGLTNTVWEYFRPQDDNPAVLAWIGTILIMSLAGAGWTLFGGGARKIRQYSLLRIMGRRNAGEVSESAIKFFACLTPVVTVFWIFFVSSMDVPVPGGAHPVHAIAVHAAPLGVAGADGYRTVFDLHEAGFKDWKFPAFGLIFVVVGIAQFIFRKQLVYNTKAAWAKKVFPYLFLGFAILWTSIVFFSTYSSYHKLLSAYDDGQAEVTDGMTEHFQPMPPAGHAMEHFCVQKKCFSYSDYVMTGGFNNTSSHGGPMRQGLPVRVTYVDSTIVKLEVKSTGDEHGDTGSSHPQGQ